MKVDNIETLLIIDGSSMLSTSYYGNLPKSILFAKTDEEKEKHYGEILHTSRGEYTNGIFTMLRSLQKILKELKPEYVAFTFDLTRDTFRRELYADYKGARKATPEPLKEQFEHMEEALKQMGFAVFMSTTYEADDYSASLVRQFESPDRNTYVLTKDHDYFQLVSDYSRMLRPMQREPLAKMIENYKVYAGAQDTYRFQSCGLFEFTKDIVLEDQGVRPDQIVDLLAIVGDPGDGIPGCKGVSSAAPLLLKEYGDLDTIYAVIDSCEGNAKVEKELAKFWKERLGIGRSPMKALKEHREMVYLSRKLAQMKCDIDLECSLEDLRMKLQPEGVRSVLERFELKSLEKDWLQ